MIGKRWFSSGRVSYLKRKVLRDESGVLRGLPKVPTTQFLESTTLSNDILFSGYRPVTYPVRENPLFRRSGAGSPFEEESKKVGEQQAARAEFNALTGERGTGGIKSGGVNGTWRMNPRVPASLLPYNVWSTSVMGMEYYPEWSSVPRRVVRELKPFEVVSLPQRKGKD